VVGAIGFGLGRAPPAPVSVVAPPRPTAAPAALSAWLVLRAFASGCTAATGIEAVSNAVPVFRRPSIPRARRTLALIVGVLVLLVAGEAWMCTAYGVGATPPGQAGYQSVLSQLVSAVAGRGALYYVTIAAVVAVLCLSANTSFAGFPRLCRVLAEDEFLPGFFAHQGRRLVYSSGIVLLTAMAAGLLIVFGGVTDRLIPLFAVGAFLAFTLSQLGMVIHWRRSRDRHARKSLVVNAIGAVTTALALVIIIVSKLTEGAWLTLLFIPAAVATFEGMRRHYRTVERQVAASGPVRPPAPHRPIVLLPLHRLDRVTRKALCFAMQISRDIRAVQILTGARDEQDDLTSTWGELVQAPAVAAGLPPPALLVIRSTYRELLGPFSQLVGKVAADNPHRTIAVLVPQLVERRWYQLVLHGHRASLMKAMLLFRGGPGVVVINSPWHLGEEEHGESMAAPIETGGASL
jgi:hypothetical protein